MSVVPLAFGSKGKIPVISHPPVIADVADYIISKLRVSVEDRQLKKVSPGFSMKA